MKLQVLVLQVLDFIIKETPAHMFSCEFIEMSKNTIFMEHL